LFTTLRHIRYDDDSTVDGARAFGVLQGAWEVPRAGQQHEPGNKGMAQRDPAP